MAVDTYAVPGGSYWQLAVTQQSECVYHHICQKCLKVSGGPDWPLARKCINPLTLSVKGHY